MSDVTRHLTAIHLDHASLAPRAQVLLQERDAAIADLLQENMFLLKTMPEGSVQPALAVHLSVLENRLHITSYDAAREEETPIGKCVLPLISFRSLIKDYTSIHAHYEQAVSLANPAKIEALDIARRSIHNESAGLVQDMLSDHIEIDFATARRLFTLIWVLHQK